MCGIVAIYHPQGRVSPETLGRATARLHHRGPDGQRQWIAPHGRVGLGHARLSIIDLVTGDQPIANEDERRQIVVNGEFYDFERIQRELGARGPPAPHPLRQRDRPAPLRGPRDRSASTSCAASSPSSSGTSRNSTLFAARDRFGIKPLFYAWHEGALYLASEVKALFAAGRARPLGSRGDCSTRPSWRYQPTETALSRASRRCRRATTCSPPDGRSSCTATGISTTRSANGSTPKRSDEEYAERVRRGAGRGGAASAARRRAGRLLSQRRPRLLQRAGPGRPAPARADPRLHAHLRPAAYDEGAIAREMAAHAGAEFCPDPDPAGGSRRPLRRRDLARGDALRQRARRREVRPQPGGARRRVQGRAHRRGLGRDPGGLSPLPARHAALRQRRAGSGGDPIAAGRSWSRAIRSRAACCCPTATPRRSRDVRRVLGFVPSWLETAGAAGCTRCRRSGADDFRGRVRRCTSRIAACWAASTCAASCRPRAGEPGRCTCGPRPCCPTTS